MSICLAMIVKNEAHVIRRCLASVLPIISSWAIVDTGSTDGTQEIIREFLKDIPGELIEREWVDFSTNRNQAIELAKDKADYTFTLDADEELILQPSFSLPDLDKCDLWHVNIVLGDCHYFRRALWRSSLPSKYVSILHEVLVFEGNITIGNLPGCHVLCHPEGSRSNDAEKYKKDAELLEKALLNEPENTRYQFYCGQSHRDSGNWERSLHWYSIRATSGGWPQEIFYAQYQIALLKESLGRPWGEVLEDFLKAFEIDPTRAEPLYRIAIHYQGTGQWVLARHFFEAAMKLPEPHEALFVVHSIYAYYIPLNYAVALYWTGAYQESINLNEKLLAPDSELPENLKELVNKNIEFAKGKMSI
jgi:glycosyltransferase involved in cell wall biosynthesis